MDDNMMDPMMGDDAAAEEADDTVDTGEEEDAM